VTVELTAAERLKFHLFAQGITISPAAQAYIDAANGDRAMTPADYASTSGIILALDDDVWVNAPVSLYNPNFVREDVGIVLDLDGGGLVVNGHGLSSPARFWVPPRYHDETNGAGEAYTSYAFTHGDRVRISPVEGCAIACHFCNLPYEFRYRTKSVEGLVDSVARALRDEIQPAHHVLISGGTPRDEDVGYVRDVYEAVITGFPGLPVDVMMVPDGDLLDLDWLARIGVNELSVNLEIWNADIGRRLMRRKHDQGRDHYLAFLARAAEVLGRGRARSMLMVGLEPAEDTLAGVAALAERGAVPVLSPFRPDPATPLRRSPPPSLDLMVEVFLRSWEICDRHGVALGPGCLPCSHNTMTLGRPGGVGTYHAFGEVHLV
jgi:hypothetical protein